MNREELKLFCDHLGRITDSVVEYLPKFDVNFVIIGDIVPGGGCFRKEDVSGGRLCPGRTCVQAFVMCMG